ncbi:MAG: aminopeptidase P family N-terminal domain-containing protein, partial [Hyphomonadaceae bacterium]|nr:aminopeptidase P family N-terminal domain-containing protein [Clostridia bacterium]
MSERIDEIRKMMSEKKWDGVFVTSDINRYYMSSF